MTWVSSTNRVESGVKHHNPSIVSRIIHKPTSNLDTLSILTIYILETSILLLALPWNDEKYEHSSGKACPKFKTIK